MFLRVAFPELIFLVWPLDVFVSPSETAVLGNTRKNSHEHYARCGLMTKTRACGERKQERGRDRGENTCFTLTSITRNTELGVS